MKQVNLGCGRDIRKGFVNIDAVKGRGVDMVLDIRNRLPFASGSVDAVVAWDVLEHVTVQEQEKILGEIYRIMGVNGRLEVRIPNIEDIINRFADDPETRNLFLYGDTAISGSWGAHKCGQTLKSFLTVCRMTGLIPESYRRAETNWIICLRKSIPVMIGPGDQRHIWVLKGRNIDKFIRSVIGKLTGKAVVWVEDKPVTNHFVYRLFGFLPDEVSVKDQEVFDSLFPWTHISAARVMIGKLEYQIRRAKARKLVESSCILGKGVYIN